MVLIRFYEELNCFLAVENRKKDIPCVLRSGVTAKKLIEDLGVPHTEVDLIMANGASVSFAYRLRENDRISVYPVFESFDVSGISRVRPAPLRRPRFILDVHLGKLARMMRMLGFDVRYSDATDDESIVCSALGEKRIILSRDRGLLKRKAVTHGYCVRSMIPAQQTAEVLRRFHLEKSVKPLSRCPECNSLLKAAGAEVVAARVPQAVRSTTDSFRQCPTCGRIYWSGSHWRSLAEQLKPYLGFPLGE